MSRVLLSLLCIGAVLSGCDALDAPALQPSQPAQLRVVRTATGVALEAPAAHTVAGDFHFRLDPLAAGTTVSAELRTTGADPRLEYATDGGDVRLVAADADAVRVAYLADGQEVASAVHMTAADDGVYSGGSSSFGPTSYHYVRGHDGSISITWDYNAHGEETQTRGAKQGRGSTVRTPAGETARVTHIQFTAWGMDLGTVESVEILSPSAIHIAEASVRR